MMGFETRSVETWAVSRMRGESRLRWWNPRFAPLFLVNPPSGAEDATRWMETKERHTMITKQLVLAGCAAIVLSIATAQAGPCNTVGKSAQDAGSGPTPGNTGQTIGTR